MLMLVAFCMAAAYLQKAHCSGQRCGINKQAAAADAILVTGGLGEEIHELCNPGGNTRQQDCHPLQPFLEGRWYGTCGGLQIKVNESDGCGGVEDVRARARGGGGPGGHWSSHPWLAQFRSDISVGGRSSSRISLLFNHNA
jgi:hypothetical protein